MVLARLKVNDKNNEITAIAALLKTLMLKGCVVTIDALGYLKEISSKIGQQWGDYILTHFVPK